MEDVGWTWHFTLSTDLFLSGSRFFPSFISFLQGAAVPARCPFLPLLASALPKPCLRRMQPLAFSVILSEGNSPGNGSNVKQGA